MNLKVRTQCDNIIVNVCKKPASSYYNSLVIIPAAPGLAWHGHGGEKLHIGNCKNCILCNQKVMRSVWMCLSRGTQAGKRSESARIYLILSLGQLLLELLDTQAQFLDLALMLLHTPVCMGQLSHLFLVLFFQFGVHVFQISQFLGETSPVREWGGHALTFPEWKFVSGCLKLWMRRFPQPPPPPPLTEHFPTTDAGPFLLFALLRNSFLLHFDFILEDFRKPNSRTGECSVCLHFISRFSHNPPHDPRYYLCTLIKQTTKRAILMWTYRWSHPHSFCAVIQRCALAFLCTDQLKEMA